MSSRGCVPRMFRWTGDQEGIPLFLRDMANENWLVYDEVESLLHVKSKYCTEDLVDLGSWVILGESGKICLMRDDFQIVPEEIEMHRPVSPERMMILIIFVAYGVILFGLGVILATALDYLIRGFAGL